MFEEGDLVCVFDFNSEIENCRPYLKSLIGKVLKIKKLLGFNLCEVYGEEVYVSEQFMIKVK